MSFKPEKYGAKCSLCPRKGQVPVPPTGPRDALTVWLGGDPGEQDVKHLEPFIGPTGKRMTHVWNNALTAMRTDIPRGEILMLNATCCAMVTKKDGEGFAASDCCWPLVKKFLRSISPEAGILAMGKLAFYTLTGRKKGIGKYQGFFVKLKGWRKMPDFEAMKKKQDRAANKLAKELKTT